MHIAGYLQKLLINQQLLQYVIIQSLNLAVGADIPEVEESDGYIEYSEKGVMKL